MNENINYNQEKTPPHFVSLIIQRLISIYKFWLEIQDHIPKKSRYTLFEKIDLRFLETIELALAANYLSKEQKLSYLQKAVHKLDVLKFLLQIAWETKNLDNKKYIILSEKLNEIGRMLGGWIKGIIKTNSARSGE